MKTERTILACLSLLVTACTGELTSGPKEPAIRSAPAATFAWLQGSAACRSCVFGPRTYTRSTSAPMTEVVSFAGDPAADYMIDIDEAGSVGAGTDPI